jgi:hypothetical protein
LGERLNGIQEVDGSIPFGSTMILKDLRRRTLAAFFVSVHEIDHAEVTHRKACSFRHLHRRPDVHGESSRWVISLTSESEHLRTRDRLTAAQEIMRWVPISSTNKTTTSPLKPHFRQS